MQFSWHRVKCKYKSERRTGKVERSIIRPQRATTIDPGVSLRKVSVAPFDIIKVTHGEVVE